MTEQHAPYPVRVDAARDPEPSRWLWLVKWLLLLPHFVVLAFLWLAFVVLSVVAFVAILITARYPRPIFDFNVGVLRWSWRVHYYGYGALGTDRYPPFTLHDVPDYPARLDVEYPARLSRGLVLVKWWLLALPHYLIVALFAGGGLWVGTGPGREDGWDNSWGAGGLVALLVFIAGVIMLFTGRYPRSLYDFVLGMDRWVLRVAGYAALMTDRYPPFRMDLGGPDPASLPVGPPPAGPGGAGAAVSAGTPAVTAAHPSAPGGAMTASAAGPAVAPHAHTSHGRWSAGRVVAVVLGALLVLASTGPLVTGGALLWADQTQREDGWLTSPAEVVSTTGHALVSEDVRLDTDGADWVVDDLLGRVRLQVTPDDPAVELFLGVGRSADVAAYLAGVAHRRMGDLEPGGPGGQFGREDRGWGMGAGMNNRDDRGWGMGWGTDWSMGPGMMTELSGGPPAVPPAQRDIWVAQASGSGAQTLDWVPADGNWTVVVMRADGTDDVAVTLRVAATLPALNAVAWALLAGGVVLLALGGLLIALAVHRAQSPGTPPVPAEPVSPPPTVGPSRPVPAGSGGPAGGGGPPASR